MTKIHPRKTTKANWSMDHIKKATKLVDEHGYSLRRAAKTMNISFSSFRRDIRKIPITNLDLGVLPSLRLYACYGTISREHS